MTSPQDPYGDRPDSGDAADRETSFMGGWWRKENEDPVAGYRPGDVSEAQWSVQGPPAQGPPAQGPPAQGPPAQGPPAQDGNPTYAQPNPYEAGRSAPEQWGQDPAGHGSAYLLKPPNDGLAIGSLVVGIASLALICFYGLGLLGSPFAIGLGVMSRRRISRSQGRLGGRGLATTGAVLGAIGTVLLVGLVVLVVVVLATGDWDSSTPNALLG